ncbi:MAG TPA: DinB family protein [Candidatus Paceibacterota bacterium]|nr:DinB family protein [Candidatus Paceibacterota bacterium]
MERTIAETFLEELEAEEKASRRCIERIPESLFDWKPHEKSMQMGYLSLLVADIPKWLVAIIEKGEVNFAIWEKYELTTTADLVKRFEENMAAAKNALKNMGDEAMQETFVLKAGEQELMKTTKKESISSSLNHWVHHRGQLTVYMRLNGILVPSIYGPSADEKTY